jgi:hypothetical protein
MKKLSFAATTLAALFISFLLFSNTNHKISNSRTRLFQMESLDDPDKDSLISYDAAMQMHQQYLNDDRKIKFSYHDKISTDPISIVEANMEGMIFNASTIQDLINKSKCSKVYVMFGMNFQKRKNAPGITDTIFTTILMPVSGSKGNYTFMPQFFSPEYSSPCPPYCPR